VAPQQVAVELNGLGPQAGPLVDPRVRVLAKEDAARVGVESVAVQDLGFLRVSQTSAAVTPDADLPRQDPGTYREDGPNSTRLLAEGQPR
jgi:hypothetical protein